MDENNSSSSVINGLSDFISVITSQSYYRNDERLVPQKDISEEFLSFVEKYRSQGKNKGAFVNNDAYIFVCKHANELYDFLWYLKYIHLNKANRQRTFYRGVSNCSYLFEPSIYRYSSKEENMFIKEMQVRCPNELEGKMSLECLTFLQHYGCPTRLLDITSNPLVALYFASLSTHADGAVHIFKFDEPNVLYHNSNRVQLLSCLSEFTEQEQNELMTLAYLNFANPSGFSQKTNSMYADEIIEKLFCTVKRQNPAFERKIDPFDLLNPLVVQPLKDNPRIMKQDGAFILSGLSCDAVDCDNKIRKLLYKTIIVPRNIKSKILKELDIIGVCEATLFPEPEHVSNYLKNN